MMLNVLANFEMVPDESTDAFLVIRDLDGAMSITNNAEAVVDLLVRQGYVDNGRRLLYYDTHGDLDEMVIVNGKFDSFALARHPRKEL